MPSVTGCYSGLKTPFVKPSKRPLGAGPGMTMVLTLDPILRQPKKARRK